MSQKQTSKRSYQQRSSSYKRNFGTPTPGQHSPLPMPMVADRNNGTSFTRTTYRSEISTSGGGASSSGAGFSGGASSSFSNSGAGLGEERITSMRSIPVTSAAVNMSEINQMASSMGSDFQMMRMNEKSEMQTLNTRLAGFIQKVRALEQANKVLEVKLEQLQSINPERIGAMYEDELARLRAQIEELQHDKANLRLQLDNAYLEIEKINNKLEEEIVTRREIEEDLNNARKDCDEATLGRLDLESRIKALQEEIEFLNRVHNEEVAELHSRLRNTEVRIDTAPGPDLEALLEEMRQQYENMNKKNHANTERMFQEKVTGLQEAAVRNDQALRGARQEVNEVRKEMQSITFEMEALRGTNDALRRNIGELEDRYNRDVADYQETIMSMQNECDDLKKKMAEHLRQYQDLMGVKVALDMEISMYRKLLEGEETRLSESVEKIKQAQFKYTNQGASTSSGASSSSMMMQGGSSQMKQSDVDELETITKKKLVVTTIETKDGKVISETEDVRELNG